MGEGGAKEGAVGSCSRLCCVLQEALLGRPRAWRPALSW